MSECALAFAGLGWNVHTASVPIAPAGPFTRGGSTADGATQIIRDDVAALPHSKFEQFGAVA
jgi:hypothetical protein